MHPMLKNSARWYTMCYLLPCQIVMTSGELCDAFRDSIFAIFTDNRCGLRSREGQIAAIKSKNNMLLAVLVLTNLTASIKISQDIIEHACYTIGQRIRVGGEVRLGPSCQFGCVELNNFSFAGWRNRSTVLTSFVDIGESRQHSAATRCCPACARVDPIFGERGRAG